MPVYNTERLLSRAINSVLNQTYTSIEILLIDDESTDDSGYICEYYAEKYDNIKYYKIPHGGVSKARNFGIDQATGDFIGFIDSDDIAEPEMYEKLYQALIENNTDIAACNYDKIGANGEVIFSLKHYKDSPCKVVNDYVTNMLYILTYGSDILPNKLFRKTIFDDIRLPQGKDYEDIMTVPLIIEKASSVVYINDLLYHYILRSDNITSDVSYESVLSFLQSKRYRYDYVKEKNKVLATISAVSLLDSVVDWLEMFKKEHHEKFMNLFADLKPYIICLGEKKANKIKKFLSNNL